jgi:hypothetical protein
MPDVLVLIIPKRLIGSPLRGLPEIAVKQARLVWGLRDPI